MFKSGDHPNICQGSIMRVVEWLSVDSHLCEQHGGPVLLSRVSPWGCKFLKITLETLLFFVVFFSDHPAKLFYPQYNNYSLFAFSFFHFLFMI